MAYLAAAEACAGAVISASHNPFADNGIKLFAPGGRKLPDDVEEAHRGRAASRLLGDVAARSDRRRRRHGRTQVAARSPAYVDAPRRRRSTAGRLDGLRVVLDCANGAAQRAGPASCSSGSAPT